MRGLRRRAFAAAACCALLGAAAPAFAVDRALGANVPKPSPSGAPWTDAEIAALGASVGIALAGAPVLRGAHVGVYAIDARDGRVLYERNQDELFQPASTLKLLVGSAALERLGPDARFRTEAVLTGQLSAEPRTSASLVVRAGGDPFLRSADFDDLATALAARGVTALHDVAFDIARFEGPNYLPGWSWDDFPYAYAPLVSALAFEENAVRLTVTPGDAVGAKARVTASPATVTIGTPVDGCGFSVLPLFVPLATTGAAGSDDTTDLVRTPFGCTNVVGTIPIGAKPGELEAAVPFPTAYAWQSLSAALQRHGIATLGLTSLTGRDLHVAFAPADAPVVWTHESEPMRDVVADLWQPSDNLVAEMLLRHLGVPAGGGQGTSAAGIAFEKTWLQRLGVDPSALALDDGSGLSAYDRITPRALVAILAHDWNGPNRDIVLDALPIAGVRGTLRTSFAGTAAAEHLFAKTGTLSHVSALAGYVATVKHGTVIFAFQVDDWVGDAAALRDLRARVLSRFIDG